MIAKDKHWNMYQTNTKIGDIIKMININDWKGYQVMRRVSKLYQ